MGRCSEVRTATRRPVTQDLPRWRFFRDPNARHITDMDVDAFKASLDAFIDDVNADSARLIPTRPRFVHAVAVVADPTRAGEVLKATCIKQLDPYHVVIHEGAKGSLSIEKVESADETLQQPLAQAAASAESRERADSEIEAALKMLEESRDLLEHTALTIKFPSELRALRETTGAAHV